MGNFSNTVFIVGFPGFAAREVAKKVGGLKDTKVELLAPSENLDEAKRFASSEIEHCDVIEGTISKIDFGMGGEKYLELASRVTAVLYCYPPRPPGNSGERFEAKTRRKSGITCSVWYRGDSRYYRLSGFHIPDFHILQCCYES